MSSALSYHNLTMCNTISAEFSQIEPAIAVELHWALTGLAIAVVIVCVVFTTFVLIKGEQPASEHKKKKASPTPSGPGKTSKKIITTARALSRAKLLSSKKAVEGAIASAKAMVSVTLSNTIQEQKIATKHKIEETVLPEITHEEATREEDTLVEVTALPTANGITEVDEEITEPETEKTVPSITTPEETVEEKGVFVEISTTAIIDNVADVEETTHEQEMGKTILSMPTPEEMHAEEIALTPRVTMAPLGISELKIEPTEARPGQAVTISFKATNNSDVQSYYSVTMKINGEVVATEGVSLLRRLILPMSFTVAATLAGDYIVDINGKPDRFTVLESNTLY